MTGYTRRFCWGFIVVLAIAVGIPMPSKAIFPYSLVVTNGINRLSIPQAPGQGKNFTAPRSLKVQMLRAWWEAKDYVTYGVPQWWHEDKTTVVGCAVLLLALSAIVLRAHRRGKRERRAFGPGHDPIGAEDELALAIDSGKHDEEALGPCR